MSSSYVSFNKYDKQTAITSNIIFIPVDKVPRDSEKDINYADFSRNIKVVGKRGAGVTSLRRNHPDS